MTHSTESATRPGRPRNPAADESILAAARAMLAGGGLSGLTIEGVAARAGVAKTTVYRRYPTKIDLAIAAIADLVRHPPISDEITEDMRSITNTFGEVLGDNSTQAAFLAVAGAAATNPELHDLFERNVIQAAREQVADRVQHAQALGYAVSDVDLDFLHDVLIGTVIHRQIIRQQPLDDAFVQRLAKLMEFLFS